LTQPRREERREEEKELMRSSKGKRGDVIFSLTEAR
jgi:hypothetical protein